MTKEEFATKLKTLQFRKVTSANGAKGYRTTIVHNGKDFDITCFAGPDMKAKRGLDCAWDMILRRLAQEYGYAGDLTAFR